MTRDQILSILRGVLPDLHTRYGVSGLLLFGSFARGDNRPDSDVDLLAEFDRPISLFGLGALKSDLEELLGRTVDLGPLDSLRPSARDEVMSEARRVA